MIKFIEYFYDMNNIITFAILLICFGTFSMVVLHDDRRIQATTLLVSEIERTIQLIDKNTGEVQLNIDRVSNNTDFISNNTKWLENTSEYISNITDRVNKLEKLLDMLSTQRNS